MNIKKILFQLAILLIPFQLFSQFSYMTTPKLKNLQNSTTYFVMKDTSVAEAEPYIDMFRKTWSLSKIALLNYSDIENVLADDAFFIGIHGNKGYFTYSSGPNNSNSTSIEQKHIYLEMWHYTPINIQRKKWGKLANHNFKSITKILIQADIPTLEKCESMEKFQIDGEGHYYNWGVGLFKNYLQKFMFDIEKNKDTKIRNGIVIKSKLKTLKHEKLYVADYILKKIDKQTKEETLTYETADLFGNFKSEYELISTEKLNEMILNEAKPFYYLLRFRDNHFHYLSIFNSATGQVIYGKIKAFGTTNIGKRPIKKLNRKIN